MSTTARRYAAALHNCGCSVDSLRQTAQYLMDSAPLWEALCSPAVQAKEKKAVLNRLPNFTDDEHLKNFYGLLAEKSRFSLLPEIVDEYRKLEMRQHGEGLCVLRCVRDPGDDALSKLAKLLCKKHGYQSLTFEIVLDPEVLGGFVFELDGVTYDKSVRGHIHALAQSLQEG